MAWSLYRLLVTSINLWQEIFSIDMLRALKFALEHRRKSALRWLQLYGDQARDINSLYLNQICSISYRGGPPYPGHESEDIKSLLEHGYRMTRPAHCANEM